MKKNCRIRTESEQLEERTLLSGSMMCLGDPAISSTSDASTCLGSLASSGSPENVSSEQVTVVSGDQNSETLVTEDPSSSSEGGLGLQRDLTDEFLASSSQVDPELCPPDSNAESFSDETSSDPAGVLDALPGDAGLNASRADLAEFAPDVGSDDFNMELQDFEQQNLAEGPSNPDTSTQESLVFDDSEQSFIGSPSANQPMVEQEQIDQQCIDEQSIALDGSGQTLASELSSDQSIAAQELGEEQFVNEQLLTAQSTNAAVADPQGVDFFEANQDAVAQDATDQQSIDPEATNPPIFESGVTAESGDDQIVADGEASAVREGDFQADEQFGVDQGTAGQSNLGQPIFAQRGFGQQDFGRLGFNRPGPNFVFQFQGFNNPGFGQPGGLQAALRQSGFAGSVINFVGSPVGSNVGNPVGADAGGLIRYSTRQGVDDALASTSTRGPFGAGQPSQGGSLPSMFFTSGGGEGGEGGGNFFFGAGSSLSKSGVFFT